MLSKYQDENVETQRLEINNNENGHNRYSGHNWCIYPTSYFKKMKTSIYERANPIISIRLAYIQQFIHFYIFAA